MVKKICMVTGSRAEWGILKHLATEIKKSKKLELHIIVTGPHLNPHTGSTFKEIEANGFSITNKVETEISSGTQQAISKSIGIGVSSFSDILPILKPDLVLILGDRYEIFSVAIACLPLHIPVAHIHGGELTLGAIDDTIRHCITKLSRFHFVAHDEYKKRVIQLGEQPNSIFVIGNIGADAAIMTQNTQKEKIEKTLKIKLSGEIFLVTYHPETYKSEEANIDDFKELTEALKHFQDSTIIFTFPNNDAGGNALKEAAMDFCQGKDNTQIYDSLGQNLYHEIMKLSSAVIGNSSSGLIEAPAIGVPTINIGKRQDGRIRTESIIDCPADKNEIIKKINFALSQKRISAISSGSKSIKNNNAAKNITKILASLDLRDLSEKVFNDLESK